MANRLLLSARAFLERGAINAQAELDLNRPDEGSKVPSQRLGQGPSACGPRLTNFVDPSPVELVGGTS